MIALWRALLFGAACALAAQACEASSLRYCERPAELSAAEQDKLFRFSSIVKDELQRSGQGAALIARSGLDLSRFGVRYSHEGVSLQQNLDTPWSVRQLYYACDERRPRIFDQGLAGFLLGTDNPALGYVSVVLLPDAESTQLERAALDKRQALEVLAPAYSANAYAFSERYQNCNQWVAELIATAWGGLDGDDVEADRRGQAQRWLKAQGYEPSVFELGFAPLRLIGAFIPWVHSDDHPREDLSRAVYRVSMPASIEAFVHARVPEAQRIEFCHTEHHVVIHRGWDAVAEGCVAGEQDEVVSLD